MKSILFINSVCGYGSTGKICTDLYDLATKNGYECCIAYGRGMAPDGYNTIKIGNRIDNYTHVAETRIFDRHGLGSKKATKQLIEEIKIYNPDIIHLHNLHGYYINIEILFDYLKKCNKKIIWTLHDCWAFTGHCPHFEYEKCYKWKSHCHKCIKIKEYPKSITDRSYQNFSDKKKIFTNLKNLTIITPSKWLAHNVKESFLNEYDVQVISNGVDTFIFNNEEHNRQKNNEILNKKVILGVSSVWNKKKGLNVFLDLSKELDESFQIVLIGLTEPQIKKLPKNVIGIKKTKNMKELADWYHNADVFVNPTMEDTYPTVNLEAIACGTPVITTNVGGAPETISKKTGVVVNNPKKIKETIISIVNKEITFNFKSVDVDKIERFKKYLDLYERLANESTISN